MLPLSDVVLTVVGDAVPEAAVRWPVRTEPAAEYAGEWRNTYLCGRAAEVRRHLSLLNQRGQGPPLGLVVEEADGLESRGAAVEVVPELSSGFSAGSWEAVVAAVCSRHVETTQAAILGHARRRPDKTAVVFRENEWSFSQLFSRALSLADHLAAEGLQPSAGPVALQLSQSDLCVCVYLGLLSARYVAHCVDASPAGRLHKLTVCPSQALLCEQGCDPPSQSLVPKVIFVDSFQLDAGRPISNAQVLGELEDVAFIEYTSGSTGKPKGVATRQRAISHWTRLHEYHFPLVPGNDRVAYNLFLVWYWHIQLCQGGTMVVYPFEMNKDVSALMRYFAKHEVHRCNCLTPGLILAMLEVEDRPPDCLKVMFSGGEALPMSTCREWIRRWSHVELVNNLATTETAADISFCRINQDVLDMDILFAPLSDGIVAWKNKLEVVDEELVISGWNVASGYEPPTVSEQFSPLPGDQGNTYRSGDRAKWVSGKLVALGRRDFVVKVRGHRVDLAGLEATMDSCPEISSVAMVTFQDAVWGAVVCSDLAAVKRFAEEKLAEAHLIVWVQRDELPMTASGKRDREKVLILLKEQTQTQGGSAENLPGGAPATEEEKRVAEAWQAVLGRAIGREEPFLQAGGHSLAAMRLAKQLGISPAEVFAYPTIAAQAALLMQAANPSAALALAPALPKGEPAAVVGMAGRFPGALSVDALWSALRAGKDLLTSVSSAPDRVPRKGVVPDLGLDCAFWGIPKEVALTMDPTQRMLLECAYEALEDAGFDPLHVPGRVGVVLCGGSLTHYHREVLDVDLEECRSERPDEYFGLEIGLDKDYLATQISFRLNLHGPSETVGTACSSSLVAIVRGLQMLRLGLCEYVVCGGASFSPDDPMRKVDGMVWSPDGVCRPFSDQANGTVHSDGGGLLVLASLQGAQQRGQRVYATLLGGATNNDGARKAGYSAPSHEGQVEVIRAAHADAGISSADIGYVEAHGTGTRMGDPIEIQALAEALHAGSPGPLAPRSIAIGSVKGNVGHLNTAAGVPGFMKATLMLHNQQMVPSLYASQPNTLIPWERTPFHLAAEAADAWNGKVATVSSFGIGGTNAHVVLGVAPTPTSPSAPPRERRAFQRDSIASQRGGKANRRGAPALEAAFTPVPRQVPSEARRSEADPLAAFFHETRHERVEVSSWQPTCAAVVVEGGGALPKDLCLPADSVAATPERALVAARAAGGVLIYLGVATAPPGRDDSSQERMLMEAFHLLSALARAPRKDVEVFFVLRANLRYAALLGLLRVAAREHPELRLRIVQLEDGASVVLPALPQEILLRADGAYAPRLRPTAPPRPPNKPAAYDRALVTGGCRGIGVKVAEWLVRSGRARSLVLASRRPPRGADAAAVEQLGKEFSVDVRECDVAEWADVSRLPDCDLVVHCAGNVKDSLLLHTNGEDLSQVTRPKVRGGLHLKERFPDACMVGFSSSSGLFGPVGQATYAAANTFLDMLMPCVQWGGWAEAGMATDLGMTALPGERFFPTEVGLQCLGRAIDAQPRGDLPQVGRPVCVLDSDWPVYRRNAGVFSPEDALLADMDPATTPSLLGAARQVAGSDDHVRSWELVLGHAGARWRGSNPSWEVCQQHVVGGAPILPGTAYVAMALEVASDSLGSRHVQLTDVAFLRTMQLTAARRLVITRVRNASGSGGGLRFVSWPVEDEAAPSTLHCTCNFASAASSFRGSDLVVERRLEEVPAVYERFAAAGFHYGPSFRSTGVRSDGEAASCELPKLPCAPFPVHPAALDSALHLASLVQRLGCRGVPQAIARVEAHLGASQTAYSAVARSSGAGVEVEVLDEEEDVLCAVFGLSLAALDVPPTLSTRRRAWRPLPAEPRGTWLAVDPEAAALGLPGITTDTSAPHEALVMVATANSLEDVRLCRERARRFAAEAPCWVAVLESRFSEAAAAAAVEAGAQAVLGAPEQLAALAGGLGVSAPIVRAEGGQLWAEVLEAAEPEPARVVPKSEPYKVVMDASKAAKGARCRVSQRRPPEAHEVEVQTSFWALNFRDVLVAVGAIDTEVAGQSLGIGGECYGKVTRVGSGVTAVSEGDLVMAVPPDGMGSFATIDARWVSPAPRGMTPEEAVAGTCAYATAWLGLHWTARIGKGDRVLIHSAGGGVGLAAVNLCVRAGCVVYVTASTPEKRSLALSLGATAAFNSRDAAAFERGVREATGGEGVDVVLNSLSGEALLASIKLLRPFGRFIELGKRDQYEDTHIGLLPFLGGLTYAAAHFDVLMLRQPDRCRQLLEEVWRDLPDLPRLPTKTFPVTKLSESLEYFSKGVHIGKVLVSIEDTPALPAMPRAVQGPAGDEVASALRLSLGASHDEGGVACVPSFASLTSIEQLERAEVVITSSRAVAALARVARPGAVCVELPSWEPLASSQMDQWLSLGGSLVATEEEAGGNLREWLLEAVSEMAGPVEMDTTFESTGLDSLNLISLARRLSAKVGRAVSVADLYDHPTPQLLLDSFSGSPQTQLQRPKALCLHGFRSNRDAMSAATAPYLSAVSGVVEWIFVNAPRQASGPADPKIPVGEAFEWWGQRGGPFETGWLGPTFDGLEETLPMVKRMAPVGVVGFSQGGAVASLLECAWVALFSAVTPPGLQRRSTPSFHCYDPSEEYAEQMDEVAKHFSNKEVYMHKAGHAIPKDEELVRKFVAFITSAMAKPRTVG